ncbi:uncharacterized protein LOC143586383 [Bidens hawaiensis]|uniref:uncharacterized protein LOC143586383 n=1 Tax=Bidens hawaiensis TaxID=980011 RepID=UPI004049DD20
MKKHLAGVKGDVEPCKKVSADVRFTMQGLLKETEVKARGKSIDILDGDEEVEEVNEQSHQTQKRKRKATPNVHPFFTKVTTDPSQPTIKKAMQSKEKVHDVDLTLAMWFYDACIPTNACNSPYYQLVVDKIESICYGYKAPNYHAIRINLLKDAKKSVGLLIDSYRSDWVECGFMIMADGWRDIRHFHLINFLVYCEKGISFLKYIDASDIESNAVNLCNLFAEVAKMVGVKNVVQIVTDNAANYKCAGQMLCQKYRSVTWTPCADHCLNLALKDVPELENVAKLVKPASKLFSMIKKIFVKVMKSLGGVLDMVEKTFLGDDVLDVRMTLCKFRDAKDCFGRSSAVASRNATKPAEWWRLFGGDYPKMQTFAIRIWKIGFK